MVRESPGSPRPHLALRDWIASAGLFLATAAVILWQDAHVAVLWDMSYVLDSATRISLGQVPYRDFPFAHAPLTFLIQAAIIRLTGRVFFHHVIYAAVVGGLGTVLTWRIALHTLRERVSSAWLVALLLAAPLTVLGIYCILPLPSYDCDCACSILVAIWLLQRLMLNAAESSRPGGKRELARGLFAGASLCVPFFFKQNIGLPFLGVALAAVLLHLGMGFTRRKQLDSPSRLTSSDEPLPAHLLSQPAPVPHPCDTFLSHGWDTPKPNLPVHRKHDSSSHVSGHDFCRADNTAELTKAFAPEIHLSCSQTPILLAILAGAAATLLFAALLLHFTAGLGNYFHWTIQFAAQRRLPGLHDMLGVYRDLSLLWTLPCVIVALVLLRVGSKLPWARVAAIVLLAAPFFYTISSLFIFDDADERGDSLLALWPLLLILAAALALWNLRKIRPNLSLALLLPILLLVAINGALMSQQLWGSTYAAWPLLILLIAEMITYLDRYQLRASALIASARSLAPAMAAVISTTLLVCGAFYTASEERLSYVQFPDAPLEHSSFPQLAGLAIPGPYIANFDELLRYAATNIPVSDGLLLLPGEDPFYFVTGRTPQFPVLLFDPATDPYSPAQLVDLARQRNIRWLIVKRELQIKEDPTPQADAVRKALLGDFALKEQLAGYDIYRRKQV